MTPSDEYLNALHKALGDLSDRVQRRDVLNAEIAGLRETVRVLSSRVTLAEDTQRSIAQLLAQVDYATPNLTDAIMGLLTKVHPQELTAIEVRNGLEDTGFNFDDFSNPLSACHAALKRFPSDQVESGTPRDGKATYRAVLNVYDVTFTHVFEGDAAEILRNTLGRPKSLRTVDAVPPHLKLSTRSRK